MGTPPFDSFLSAPAVSQIQTSVCRQKSKSLACQAICRMDFHRGSVRPAGTCLDVASSGTRDGCIRCPLAQSETRPRQDARKTDRARILLLCARAAHSVLGKKATNVTCHALPHAAASPVAVIRAATRLGGYSSRTKVPVTGNRSSSGYRWRSPSLTEACSSGLLKAGKSQT